MILPSIASSLATRFGQDVRVAILSYRSRALWMLGHPEAARSDAEQALTNAREIGQAAALMFTVGHVPLTHIFCGDYATATAQLDEVAALADEKGASSGKASATMNSTVAN